MTRPTVGTPVVRVDGLLKVTGKAMFAADYAEEGLLHAVIFKSTVAAGRIRGIDTQAAEAVDGVIKIISHLNAPKLKRGVVLQSDEIKFYGQHIGVVVAQTFEQAVYATSLVNVDYEVSDAATHFEQSVEHGEGLIDTDSDTRGNFEAAYQEAREKVDLLFETPIEHHHPMEPHATVAVWKEGSLTLYNPSQIVTEMQHSTAEAFGLPADRVRIVCPYIGGGFGSKGGGPWENHILAAIAAKVTGRPVKLALMRSQMFNSVGLRQRNMQHIRLSATADGILTAIAHRITTHTAIDSRFVEPCANCSKMMYAIPNALFSYRVAPMNVITPTYTRAPGYSTGSFALESAMDELAYKLKIDPIDFRLRNEPERDPSNGREWSSRTIVACLQEGRKAFGWDKRKFEPRQNIQGDYFVGYGVACGTYPAHFWDSSAAVRVFRDVDGLKACVEMAATDLGTGTYTILAQIAADGLGIPMERIAVKIGDSSFAPAAGSVASVGATSFCNAVYDACHALINQLLEKSGEPSLTSDGLEGLMSRLAIREFAATAEATPPAVARKYSSHSFNATFTEVWVNLHTGTVQVKRTVVVTGAGRILNPLTARSQVIGGNVWGIGMALTEESIIDSRWGNFATRSFADYHIPVNMDVGEIETVFIDEKDLIPNKLGIKSVGEVGIVGAAASIANAVFNATGKRVRSLPITPDKLL